MSPWRQGLARWAVRGAAVLVVEVPGGWAARVAVERALAERAWRAATSPADADALVVCGEPGEGWGEVLERTWAQLPGPRARASVRSAEEADAALGSVAASLLDDDAQRADAAARDLAPSDVEAGDDMHPAGLGLAGGEDDLRDGLEMDVLTVPLGPVLPDWPAGLVLRTVLSGDVVVRARVEVLPGPAGAAGAPVGGPARRLDAAAQVLRLAGADDLAADAVRLRDAALRDPAPTPGLRSLLTPADARGAGEAHEVRGRTGRSAEEAHEVRGGVGELRRRVERSRVLRWALRSSGEGQDDVRGLLLHLLDADAHDDDLRRRTRSELEALPERLVGRELVTARLLVAVLDLRTDALTADALAALAPADETDDEDGDGAEHAHHQGHAHG